MKVKDSSLLVAGLNLLDGRWSMVEFRLNRYFINNPPDYEANLCR